MCVYIHVQRASLIFLVLMTASASADPRRPTFSAATTYESCTTSWMFACNMRDQNGQMYGTARPIKMCARYEFHPDGTYSANEGFLPTTGTYRIAGGKVWITTAGTLDVSSTSFELALSADGATLGTMKRR